MIYPLIYILATQKTFKLQKKFRSQKCISFFSENQLLFCVLLFSLFLLYTLFLLWNTANFTLESCCNGKIAPYFFYLEFSTSVLETFEKKLISQRSSFNLISRCMVILNFILRAHYEVLGETSPLNQLRVPFSSIFLAPKGTDWLLALPLSRWSHHHLRQGPSKRWLLGIIWKIFSC